MVFDACGTPVVRCVLRGDVNATDDPALGTAFCDPVTLIDCPISGDGLTSIDCLDMYSVVALENVPVSTIVSLFPTLLDVCVYG